MHNMLFVYGTPSPVRAPLPRKQFGVKVDLPRAASSARQAENVQLAIDASGQLYWNGERIDAAQFSERLKTSSALQPQPELQIRAERTTPYEKVAQVMSEAARQGLTRIGFVTDPSAR